MRLIIASLPLSQTARDQKKLKTTPTCLTCDPRSDRLPVLASIVKSCRELKRLCAIVCFAVAVVQITIMSTNSLTGVASSRFASRQRSRISPACVAGKTRARFVLNFSTSTGIPSLRRRL